MALGENTGGTMYLNIKEGRIAFKDKITKEKKTTGFVSGTIVGVKFEEKEWEGKKYEQASIMMVDGNDHYTLQMKTDSGYFRAFCNALRSGDPTKRIKITPTFTVDGAKKSSGMFVNQGNDPKALSWYSTKADPKDVPKVEAVTFKGQVQYDGTKAIQYWKNWLQSIKFESDFEASSLSQPWSDSKPKQEPHQYPDKPAAPTFTIDEDEDLPF